MVCTVWVTAFVQSINNAQCQKVTFIVCVCLAFIAFIGIKTRYGIQIPGHTVQYTGQSCLAVLLITFCFLLLALLFSVQFALQFFYNWLCLSLCICICAKLLGLCRITFDFLIVSFLSFDQFCADKWIICICRCAICLWVYAVCFYHFCKTLLNRPQNPIEQKFARLYFS